MKTLLLTLALLATALAGCTSPLDAITGGGDLTAKDAAARGEARARQWQGDAVLTGMAGPEGREGSPFNTNFSRGDGPAMLPDGNIGDGRLPQWFLQYRSPSANASLGVAVFRNGTVLAMPDDDDRDGVAIRGWDVDSPRAASIAMQDANFSRAARAADGGIVYALGQDDDQPDPFWVLTAGSESERTGGFVLVNARTGERLQMPFFGGGFGFPPGFPFGEGSGRPCAEAHQFGGTVGLQEPEATHDFDVAPSCRRIEVRLEWSGAAPTDSIALELRDPGGRAMTPQDESEEQGSYEAAFVVRGGGSYEVVVMARSTGPAAVRTTYTLEVDLA